MRDKSLDFVKGVVIYLVVWGHVIQHVGHAIESSFAYKIIYSFHMPLFIFMSGYFAAHTLSNGVGKVAEKVWNRLLVPALIWSSVQLLILLVIGYERGPLSMIVGCFRDKWFLYCLAFLYVLGCVVFKAGRWKYVVAVVLAVLGYAVYKVPGVAYIEYFQPIRQWPLFVMGFAYYEYKQEFASRQLTWTVSVAAGLVYLGCLMLWLVPNPLIEYIKTHENSYLLRAVIYQTGAVAWFAVFRLLYSWMKNLYGGGARFVASLGCNTMGVYVIHGKILLLIIMLFPSKMLGSIPYCFTAVILTMVSFAVTLLLKKSQTASKYLLGE